MANDYHWRSTKAKKQLRDRFGRWIALGAKVRYRSNGAEQAGTVTSVVDGKAYIDQKNRDGSVTQQILDPSAIRVLASKATIPTDNNRIFDAGNNFAEAMKRGEYKQALAESKEAYIERADGYALSAQYEDEALGMDQEAKDGTEPHEDKEGANPLLFQLYAPGGRSLGQYGEEAAHEFDDMVADDKGTSEADTAPAGGGEAAPAASGPMAASIEVRGNVKPYRVPEAVKLEIAATLAAMSPEESIAGPLDPTVSTPTPTPTPTPIPVEPEPTPTPTPIPVEPEPTPLPTEPLPTEPVTDPITDPVEPVTDPITDPILDSEEEEEEDVQEEPSGLPGPITITRADPTPKAVPSPTTARYSGGGGDDIDDHDLAIAYRLLNDPTVSLDEVKWIHDFFEKNLKAEQLRGGFKGRKWASRIIESLMTEQEETPADDENHPKYNFDDDEFAYFAIGDDPSKTTSRRLLAVDYETGEVFEWGPEGFKVKLGTDITDVDEPQVMPIDEMTADTLARALDGGAEEYDVADADAEERNLFSLASSELDFEEIDRAANIILAAAGDGVYTPSERSQNAKTQGRGAGGKFGETPDTKAKTVSDQVQDEPQAEKVQKARLPLALPLVADPAARIAEWLSTAAEAPVVAAGEAPVTEVYTEEDQAVEDAATGPTDEALYFAIVDEIDKTAVMDAIAIVKQNGAPSAFLRAGGAWTPSPDMITILQGSTPPPVVELPDPETVKTVIKQIDAHDSGADQTEVSEEMAPQAGETPIAASGFAMPDGSYTIIEPRDIEEAVVASGAVPDLFVKAHIRKRARALNRMDLVPAAWRELSLAEIGELSASKGLYGEFGEIIVASGASKAGGGSAAQLRAYWTTGKGAMKVRWGTPGDLTRCHRHLSKYVGPQRAWSLAQSYHQSLFGVYNHTHDVATGQYVPRKKK